LATSPRSTPPWRAVSPCSPLPWEQAPPRTDGSKPSLCQPAQEPAGCQTKLLDSPWLGSSSAAR
jgi:hypothetical protein